MGERKVLSKYYPPDFDPSKLPRIQKKRQNDDAVRFMLPMSVRCQACGEFMGVGLKFNARKADTGDTYLGIRIFRFTMRCKGCPAPFAIRTDPKNGDYECESGVRRNFEPWKKAEKDRDDAKKEREKQDEDAVQALENRTMDAKAQMDDLDDLHSILTENAKRAKLGVDHILKTRQKSVQTEHELLTTEAELMLQESRRSAQPARPSAADQKSPVEPDNVFKGVKSSAGSSLFNGGKVKVKVKKKISKPQKRNPSGSAAKPTGSPAKYENADHQTPQQGLEEPPPSSALLDYSSSSSSDDG